MRLTIIIDTDNVVGSVKDKSARVLGAVVDFFAYALTPFVNLVSGIGRSRIARHYSDEESGD